MGKHNRHHLRYCCYNNPISSNSTTENVSHDVGRSTHELAPNSYSEDANTSCELPP